ncbi:ketoacyl-ACP synthase III family protein [Streptacidiphilus sp. P02-A3a]|uniref:ketoacyl-ACP synthase III family protein n=1 Tax=Streptacidiphilus sp. P02-A3a TaxID=2704468 RepID=UPI0015FCAC21|nr:ketoacyl-ACP synthase III family protein [Streptacidiphilus sp. P02-A3a]QMU73255.1 3-oxoacyl-ACP synthase [Streptacidiphilus sp. P02-A3a]
MQWHDIQVAACAGALGTPEPVLDAVLDGRYDARQYAAQDYLSVCVADGRGPAELAVEAGRQALRRAPEAGARVDRLIHASVGFQGLDHWSPAAYVQHRTVGGRAAAFEVKQASNGGLVALELAAAHLTASPQSAVLITTGDCYPLPVFDRYRSDDATVRGDGGSALLLTRGEGVARLRATALVGDARHEGLHRGDEPWARAPGEHGWPVDLRRRRDAYLRGDRETGHAASQALINGSREALEEALADAKATLGEVSRFVFPNLGREAVARMFRLPELGVGDDRTTWDWGRQVGHIGAGDQAAGLARLLETGAVRPGDLVALCGVGTGFTFACAVLEITAVPRWT